MKKLLLVDADPLSLCVLDVSLRKLGFAVTTASDGVDALAKVHAAPPDLVITDTRLPTLDGIGVVRKLKERPEFADIPVMFLASVESMQDRKRALEVGVGDYLPKPVFLGELVPRIHLLLARRSRDNVMTRSGRTRFTGSTQDLAVVDLLQNFELTRKSGVVLLRSGTGQAHIYFRDGKVVDADLGAARGEEAIYRALIWSDAEFEVEFKPIAIEDAIGRSTQTLIMNGMQRLDEWVRLCEQVQPLAALLDIHATQLLDRLSRLGEIPEGLSSMLQLPSPSLHARALRGPTNLSHVVHRELGPSSSVAPPEPELTPPPPSSMPRSVAVPNVPDDLLPAALSSILPSTLIGVQAPRSAEVLPTPTAPESEPASVEETAPAPRGSETRIAAAAVAPAAPAAPPTAPTAPTETVPPEADRVTAPVLAVSQPAPSTPPHTPSHRPSAAPWTREVGSSEAPPADADEVAAGVPRRKGTVWLALGLAAAVLLAVGIGSIRSKGGQAETIQETDNRATAGSPVASAQAARPAVPAAADPAKAIAPAETAAAAAPEAGAPATAALGQAEAAPVAPVFAAPVRETAIDTNFALSSKSPLVRDAERALLKGETDRAVTFAQQAVGETPIDAEAWLTLAAARKASGDIAGAREAYRGCIAQARTASVTHCRILGRVLDSN